MNAEANQHNLVWERRQAELWDRIFQATQDVVALADSFDDDTGASVVRSKMVESAMSVGKYLVRALASDRGEEFEAHVGEARLQAVETDYWLRLAYLVQRREDVQRDLSSIITQYASIIELLQKMVRHVGEHHDVTRHKKGPKVNL